MSKVFIVLDSRFLYAGMKNNLGQIMALSRKKAQGFESNIILDKVQFSNSMQELIKDLEKQTKTTVNNVVVSFFGSYIEMYQDKITLDLNQNKSITDQTVSKIEERYKNLLLKNNKYLMHFNVNNFTLDGIELTSPLGLKGKVLEATSILFIAEKNIINNILSVFKELYLNITEVKLLPLVQMESFCSEDEKILGITLIDFSHTSTSITSTSPSVRLSILDNSASSKLSKE